MPEIGGEVGKERSLGALLKTGQTTQYEGYLDDGYYHKGLSKQYTVLTLGQYSLTTNITVNGKTDAHSNNCVYDQRTKLMWSRYVSGSVGPGSDGKLPWTTNGNGEGIFAYVAAANAAKLGGYSDWKIPNIFELESLQHLEVPKGIPDATAFPTWDLAGYTWSSTTLPQFITHALGVYFRAGRGATDEKIVNWFACLVRGG